MIPNGKYTDLARRNGRFEDVTKLSSAPEQFYTRLSTIRREFSSFVSPILIFLLSFLRPNVIQSPFLPTPPLHKYRSKQADVGEQQRALQRTALLKRFPRDPRPL